MAPKITYAQVAYLKVLIQTHLHNRKALFPDVKLRPKHHYMLHYGDLIQDPEGLKLCTALLARHFAKSSNREILFWTVQAEEAEKRGEAMAKEKVLLPQSACYFKEKTETLVQVLEEGNTIIDLLPSLPCTPQVVAVGSIFTRSCLVVVEQQILFDEPVDFHEAACLLFCAYYVLNMVYTKDLETTLEFIQRQVCGINPPKGSKGDGYRRGLVHSKILRLLNDVK
ncbi:uncharacterized protein LOC115316408 [Ixodes scapularis]|uniref:uncharacterized protein LOC115316408 n=1 Tax=Ixodes scapularis TaxID=6945 RepID=UPI001A9F2F01|nr:uncharacterized protein LOC115316408 [Ixodes scapularis]